MKIYTKTGDKGETGLVDGSRVPKDHLRVAAYGDVDELNAVLGVVLSEPDAAVALSEHESAVILSEPEAVRAKDLGASGTARRPGSLRTLLTDIQRDLFALGAQLADPTARVAERKSKAAVSADHVARLEAAIDTRDAELPPLTAFILPGGSRIGALLHLARTVCRRAERSVITLARQQPVDPIVLTYMNRLSDLLFVLARHENHEAGRQEETW